MSYFYGKFAVGLIRFLYEGEEKYSFFHRLCRVVALIADYCSLFVICLEIVSRIPLPDKAKVTALNLVVSVLLMFFWFAAPLFGCLLKRKIANPWCFFLLTLLLGAAAFYAHRYVGPPIFARS